MMLVDAFLKSGESFLGWKGETRMSARDGRGVREGWTCFGRSLFERDVNLFVCLFLFSEKRNLDGLVGRIYKCAAFCNCN